MILGIDPASKVTGYAMMREDYTLVKAGRFTEDDKKPAIERIESMLADFSVLVNEASELTTGGHVTIVIEISSGKTGKRHKGNGAGLAVYGMAVGAIVAAAWGIRSHFKSSVTVKTVYENEWTRNTPKKRRQKTLKFRVQEYEEMIANDPGGDIADAIGLCLHELDKRKWKTATAYATNGDGDENE